MNEEMPKEPGNEMLREEVVADVASEVGSMATGQVLKGAGTLADVMGTEAAAKYIRQTERNRRKSLALARRMYRPLTNYDIMKRRRRNNDQASVIEEQT